MTTAVDWSRWVTFADKKLAERYSRSRMPMTTLVEAYVDGRLDIHDIDAFLDARHGLVSFDLTRHHVRFLVTRMLPEVLLHTRAQDARVVRGHYDRGDDFFLSFLGETMIYTSAYFADESEPLEDAQRRKLARVCAKLDLRPGDEVLDIGCGWGTLALYAAERHGVRATGVTLAERGASHGNRRIEAAGLGDRARIACLDYRCLPDHVYDRIVSLEMVEHVGVRHLAEYFAVVRDHLRDDGLFLLQWCGLRRGGAGGVAPIGLRPEDMIWGLFMNEHIFSGADASLPLSAMTRAMETAGFEIQSVENWSPHYVLTIRRWHERWERHRSHICRAYGESWYRLWRLFLAWSWRIGAQGASVCYQVVAHKNLDSFPRAALFGPGAGARPAAAVTAIDASLTDHAASDVTAA